MRHRNAHRKLGRVSEHRIALLRNQATALLMHERIETTVPKAKELRPFVEKLITIAKRGVKAADPKGKTLSARRMVMRDVHNEDVVTKLFDELAPRFEARPGGYTRILKLGHRRGDAADVAQIELVGQRVRPEEGRGRAQGRRGGRPGRGRQDAEERGRAAPLRGPAAARRARRTRATVARSRRPAIRPGVPRRSPRRRGRPAARKHVCQNRCRPVHTGRHRLRSRRAIRRTGHRPADPPSKNAHDPSA